MRFCATWMSFSLAVALASAVLIALTVTPAVSLASPAAAGESAVQDIVPDLAGGESATGTLRVTLDMDDDGGWHMGSGWWMVMVVMMVLFWGGVIAVAVWGIRQFTGDRRRDGSALDIAKERLAGGEITKEEFDRIRGDLV